MSRQSIILVSLAVVGALTLSGCASDADADADAGAAAAAPAESAQPAASAETTTDAMTCTGFNDAMTIIVNADAGLAEGRMAEQEQQGWYRLATRVLAGVPTRGEGAVSDVTTTMKDLAPRIALGSMGTTGIGTAEWNVARDDLSTACSESGSEMAVERFTGG